MAKAPPPPEFSTRRGTGAVVLAGADGRYNYWDLPASGKSETGRTLKLTNDFVKSWSA